MSTPRSFPMLADPPGELTPLAARYEVATTWEEYVGGEYKTATITRQVEVRVHPLAGAHLVEWQSAPATFQKKGEVQSLEELAQRLAELYEELVLYVSLVGEPLALRNHTAVLRRWEALQADLSPTGSVPNQLMQNLLAFCAKQVADPARVLESLRFDYTYATLLRLLLKPGAVSPGNPTLREFPQFFATQDLWFWEHVTLLPTETTDQVAFELRGTLDETRTNVAAIRQLLAAARLRLFYLTLPAPAGQLPAETSIPPDPEILFYYQTTWVVAKTTGLPERVELSVQVRLADQYNKEYTLLLTRL